MYNKKINKSKVTLPPVAPSRPTDVVIERNSVKPNSLVTRTLDEQL